jgi:branched-chain amino acid aminotransferase
MYFNKNTQVYLNKKWLKASEAKTSYYDQTLHYGNGVFEGIRSYNTEFGTKIFKAKEHFERLLNSAKKMHIKVDYNVSELIEITYKLLEINNLKDAYIRPLFSLGQNMGLTPVMDTNTFICAWEWGKYLGEKPLKLKLSSYRRPHPLTCHVEAKTVGHYINSILATTEAKEKGYDEALLLDTDGFVAEGPGANFFFEKNNEIYTCPLGNILPGITRSTVFEIADLLSVKINEVKFKFDDLKSADLAFFTGTAAEVAPIASIENIIFNKKWEESKSYQIAKAYKRLVKGELKLKTNYEKV